MKKIIALIICAVMILSMIPVVVVNTAAAGEGDWITKRAPGESDEEIAEKQQEDIAAGKEAGEYKYKPAPGYHYDSEGFHTDSPSYKDITPMFYVRTREAVDVQHQDIHIEYRVDEYAYGGWDEDGTYLGRDQWFAISVWPTGDMVAGSTEYGSGWLCLIRGNGQGSAQIQPLWTEGRDADGNGGSFAPVGNWPTVEAPLDSENKEHYTFDMKWNGSSYDISVNGAAVSSGNLADVLTDGTAYITILGQTGVSGDPVSLTILDWNGSVPTGSDSKVPDENVNSFADLTPSDSIAAGEPCFLWDASCKVMRKLPESGQSCNITPKGDDTVHIVATGSQLYFTAGPSSSYTYEAKDFPVMAMVVRNYNGDDGQIWWAAGDIMGAQNDAVANWSLFDDYAKEYQVGDDMYNLIVLDMRDWDEERWVGRIHSQRLVFNNLTPGDEEFGEFDLCYFACFRSVEDAQAYADKYVASKGEITTEAPTDAPTEAPTDVATEAQGTEAQGTDVVDGTDAGTEAGSEAGTDAAAAGCASAIGASAALVLTAMAAAVALKKKH